MYTSSSWSLAPGSDRELPQLSRMALAGYAKRVTETREHCGIVTVNDGTLTYRFFGEGLLPREAMPSSVVLQVSYRRKIAVARPPQTWSSSPDDILQDRPEVAPLLAKASSITVFLHAEPCFSLQGPCPSEPETQRPKPGRHLTATCPSGLGTFDTPKPCEVPRVSANRGMSSPRRGVDVRACCRRPMPVYLGG